MDIRILSYFLEVAKSGNISRAAENLHMSQPPLSRSMQLLEEELGVTLFVRGKRKITLTHEGQLLRKRAQQMIALADKTVEEISGMKNEVSGRIYIGSIESISLGIMPKWIVEFHQQYPEVYFDWWSGNSNDVLERLEHGLIDFAVVRTPCNSEKFISGSLYREPWMAFVKQEQLPESAKDSQEISLEELGSMSLIIPSIKTRAQEIREWFGKRGIVPNICCEISPAMNAISLVENGMGAAILPASASGAAEGKGIAVRKIINPTMESEIIIVYNRDNRLSTAAVRFIQYIQESCGVEDK